MEDVPNIAMADSFMAIFGFKRVKPTDEEVNYPHLTPLAFEVGAWKSPS